MPCPVEPYRQSGIDVPILSPFARGPDAINPLRSGNPRVCTDQIRLMADQRVDAITFSNTLTLVAGLLCLESGSATGGCATNSGSTTEWSVRQRGEPQDFVAWAAARPDLEQQFSNPTAYRRGGTPSPASSTLGRGRLPRTWMRATIVPQ